MIREVDLVSYLPPFLAVYKELNETLSAENREFHLVWSAADRVLKNEFIATADEYGISRFERLLNIYPEREDTLESRRAKVQSRWFASLPYTVRMLLTKLGNLCGDHGFTVIKEFDYYRLVIETGLELFGQVTELERMIETMVPCNMAVVLKNKIECTIHGSVLTAGGICVTETFVVTNDFRDSFYISGKCMTGSGVIITETAEIN